MNIDKTEKWTAWGGWGWNTPDCGDVGNPDIFPKPRRFPKTARGLPASAHLCWTICSSMFLGCLQPAHAHSFLTGIPQPFSVTYNILPGHESLTKNDLGNEEGMSVLFKLFDKLLSTWHKSEKKYQIQICFISYSIERVYN